MNTLVAGVTYLIPDGSSAAGLYHGDTRHLLPLAVEVADVDLTAVAESARLPSSRSERYANVGTAVNEISESVVTKHATVVLDRRATVAEGRLREELELANHHPDERTFAVRIGFDADFADVFEVRKLRDALTRDVAADVDDRSVTYGYEYADDEGNPTRLETTVTFGTEPDLLEPGRAEYSITLGPQESRTIAVDVEPGGDESTVRAAPTAAAERPAGAREAVGAAGAWNPDGDGGDDAPSLPERVDPFVTAGLGATGSREYDRTFEQAFRDVRALTARTEHGPVPLAGAPWFVTVFGRDALLASYLLLPFAPTLARGTLRYLAAFQGEERSERSDESPGAILHEVRRGELARTGAIPQVPYYGTVDATPLWVTLLHETWRWTGDDDLVTELWGPLGAALDHLRTAVGDGATDDPFLYYDSLGSGGVSHKVWRDSPNGVQYGDGSGAAPPLACADVQGYLHDALRRAAELASAVAGNDDAAADLSGRADRLAARFDEAFWMPDRDFYAVAVTPEGERVDSISSAIGHCLWSGIVPSGRADEVADRLLAPDVYSGWGIRTLSSRNGGYSPISYHAGGVWPHDNALAALGLAGYGHHESACRIATSQLDAISHFAANSAPELFCGFDDSASPVEYPSACRPQVWSAAAPFGFLRALFGLDPETVAGGSEPRQPNSVASTAIEDVLAYWD